MSEKVTIKVERKKLHLPTIALRGLVVFPNNLVHFEVGREKSIAAVEWAMANNSNVFLVAQKSMDTTEPQQADLFSYGVVAEVKQVLRVSGDLVKVLVEGKYRAKLSVLDASGDFLLSEVRPAPVRTGKADDAVETEALLRALKAGFDEYLGMNPRLGKDVVFAIVSSDDPAFLSEYMPANLLFRYEDKQAVMDEGTLNGRLKKLIEMLRRECQVMKIEKEIAEKVNESMDKNQRDYYLHEQLHIISDELGEGDDTHAEADEYRRRITGLHLAEDSEKKLLKEVDRLAKMQGSNQEATVIRTYLDTCLDLPWNTFTVDDLDISRAQQILDRDHYGLKKVKDRILETLAVRKLAPDVKAQIICLVGPPGVGKTSIARSIAESLGRKYVRISLGGVRDEAEIRGHRRTYIGAMPGKIITAMISAKSANPLMLLDEIDKLAGDFRGDPAAALLEALDPEQNSTFNDHFIDIPFDLSHVLFITTANDLGSIPGPLRDRMDVIELVVADAAADKGLLDSLDGSDFLVEGQQRTVVVVQVRAHPRVEARRAAALAAQFAVAAAHAVHVGRRGSDVREVALESRHGGHPLHLAENRAFAARVDEFALMGRDRAEGAASEAAAVDVYRELDHLPGRDIPLAAVAGMRRPFVGQVERVVELFGREGRVGGCHDHEPIARRLD